MSSGRKWLCGVLAVALLIRLGAAVVVQQRIGDELCLITGDAEGYWELARRIRAGDDFALYEPPRRVHRVPGFPALLAGSMWLFGESNFAARGVLAVVGTLGCAAVYALGRQLCDETIGLSACGLTAISPAMAGFSVLILSETLFAALLTLSLWCAAKWLMGTPRLRFGFLWPVATGACIAAATLVRPSWLLAGPALACFAVWLSRDRRRVLFESAVMFVALVGSMLPWAWRNHEVCGHWVFTTLWSGPSLYDGLHPNATGESEMSFFDDERLMNRMSEWDVNENYKRRAWQFAASNPMRALELTAIKLWRYWKPWPSAQQFGGVGPALAVSLFFVPLLVFAAIGLWHEKQHFWVWLLTAGPLLYFAAIHAVFIGSLRYRLPAEYPLCVLAAVGIKNCRLMVFDFRFNRKSQSQPQSSPQTKIKN